MNSKLYVPGDVPAAACGRCTWWTQTDCNGEGWCHQWQEGRWYKCMVCEEYELNVDINKRV